MCAQTILKLIKTLYNSVLCQECAHSLLNHHQRLFQGYGITLASLGRFQLNALIERDTGGFGFFDDISEERVFLPFAWMEEGVEGPSEVSAGRNLRRNSAGWQCLPDPALSGHATYHLSEGGL